MKRALISDIHANLEALQAVRFDIFEQGIDLIYCLGDVVGYGPNPVECIDIVMADCEVTLKGNHDDRTVTLDLADFNPMARRAVAWTRRQLEYAAGPQEAVSYCLKFLADLPDRSDQGKYLFVHGSPRDPINEYVFPEDVYNERKMEALFGRIERYCFQGHTHIPGIFMQSGEFIPAEECEGDFALGGEKAMVNVGSVGQPRDGDPRACYVVFDDDKNVVHFRRVPYDLDTTIAKIYSMPDLSGGDHA